MNISKVAMENLHKKRDESVMDGGIHVSDDAEEIKINDSIQKIPDWVRNEEKILKLKNKNQEVNIEDDNSSVLSANEVRHQKLKEQHQGQRQNKKSIEADTELSAVGKNVVKNGRFSLDALDAGLEFLKKIAKWAGMNKEMSETEESFYDSLGQWKVTDFLYVDGKPLKDFVRSQYKYSDFLDSEHGEDPTLGAYLAMISLRQNHAITLIRPTFVGGRVDVDIRNLSVNTDNFVRTPKEVAKATAYAHKGDVQKEKCEEEYKTALLSDASYSARLVTGNQSKALNDLDALKFDLKHAGRGKHKNYDDFEKAFNDFYDSITLHTLSPGKELVDKAYLKDLYDLNKTVIDTATDYLKDKKMNLPRHKAVKSILDKAHQQSAALWGVLREGALDDNQQVSLVDILAKEDNDFVVIGTEKEIDNLEERADQQADDQDDFEYELIPEDIKLTSAQESALKVKAILSYNETVKITMDALHKAWNNKEIPNEEKEVLAEHFIKSAIDLLFTDADFKEYVISKYPYAENNDAMLRNIIVDTQLRVVYADEFNTIPVLQTVLKKGLDSDALKAEADILSYQHNTIGEQISKEDFEKTGGSRKLMCVAESEANKVVEASHGFFAKREVQGRKGLYELIPSMPEYITIYNGNDTQKKIPLRKTLKTMFKTFAYLMTDADGHMKSDFGTYKDESIALHIDSFIQTDNTSENDVEKAEDILKNIIVPGMTEMLTEQYRRNNVRHYEEKASEDAAQICWDYLELLRGSKSTIIPPFANSSFLSFGNTVNYVKTLTADKIMNDPRFERIKINGRKPTEKEVNSALDDFKKDILIEEAEFASLRYLDTDDEEMPAFSSSTDNNQFTENIMESFVDKNKHQALIYSYKEYAKKYPEKALDMVMAELDNIINCCPRRTEDKIKDKQIFIDLNNKRKTGPLSKEDLTLFEQKYSLYTKYFNHIAANICKIGDITYTTETIAPMDNQLIKSPLTKKILIGKYKPTAPDEYDRETGSIINDGMKKYYNHDDPFAQCHTLKETLKSQLKPIITGNASRIGA